MIDRALEQRLEALAPSGMDEARGRAKVAARVLLSRTDPPMTAADLATPGRWRGSAVSRRLVVIATVAILVATGMSVTPQGHAVASWIGERIGLGEPGGPPSLSKLRTHAIPGQVPGSAHVLLRGHGPAGPYEYVAYRSEREGATGERDVLCFDLDVPRKNSLQGAGCGLPNGPLTMRIASVGTVGSSPRARELHFLTGRVGGDISRVAVRRHGETLPAELHPVPAGLAARLGFPRPFKVFVIFFDGSTPGSRVVVTAKSAAGATVARQSVRLPMSRGGEAGECAFLSRLRSEGKVPDGYAKSRCP